VLSCRVLQRAIDDLEGARERYAQPADDLGQLTFDILVISEVERRPCGELIENRL
jgi:hypothetical protein